MLDSTFDDLLDLPETEALRRHQRSENYRRLKIVAVTAAILSFVALLAHLLQSNYPGMWTPIAVLVLARLVFMARDWDFVAHRFRILLPLTLVAFLALLALQPPSLDSGLRFIGILGAAAIAAFRLPKLDFCLLFLALWLGALALELPAIASGDRSLLDQRAMVQTMVTALGIYFGISGTQRKATEFLRTFRIETSRRRERQRMRQELDYARQIQLSMLPRADPSVPGADIAAVSLPAMEVGGDYYEYFDRGDGHLAIAVGDVAGHGVASGLLLSGIRSCLYLLRPEKIRPSDLFHRLDRMVRDTTDRRMFITLLYSVFDLEKRSLVLASAGHPAILHYRASSQDVVELDAAAPPLGTRLASTYEERQVDFGEDDVFVLYTDGLSETVNQNGELYGEARVAERLEKVAASKSAREIREVILSDLWNFKGDAEQNDDITLVVLKSTNLETAATEPS